MLAALRIAGKDLRLRVRDRSAFTIGLIAPLALAFVFNLLLGGALSGQGPDLSYGLVDLDQSQTSQSFGQVLKSMAEDDVFEFAEYPTEAAARVAVEEGEISAFYLVPSGFGGDIATGSPTITVVGDVDSPNATHIAVSIAEQFAAGVEAGRLAVVTAAQIEGVAPTPEFIGGLSTDPASAAFTFRLDDVAASVRQLDASTYFAAGMAVFFMFFTVQYGVIGMIDEERQGTMARLLAAPIARGSILLGKGILSFVLGVGSMLALVVATSFIMGAEWGPVLGVLTLVLAGAAAAVGITAVPGAFARTAEGAENLGAIVAVVLGLLGGVFFPLGQGDDMLARASLLTPHAWFLRGLGEISGGASWTAALPAAAVLLGFALVFGSIAAFVFSRRLRR